MKQWVNRQSLGESFSAIHFSSFNGNIEISQMLLDEGANKLAVNKNGLNCLHVAAQGDQPGSLYYFHKICGLEIKKSDSRGSTPLHWAIFSQSELATVYILAWLEVKDLTQQDDEGNTAMHLAIKSAEGLESSRPVRQLLFNGSPTNVADNDGLLPLDIAKELENPKLRLDILQSLQEQKTTLKQWLQYESQLKKQKRSW